ncbi:MAG: response regulator transcription factor [Pseudomonadota bacterium]
MRDHILIVDDDRQVASSLTRFFSKNGYRASAVSSVREMFAHLETDAADLIVLDLILPDEDGLDAARRLLATNDVPIIMLSARSELYDRIVGLEVGADDYVTKPYDPRELLARVRSVLRRSRRAQNPAAEETPATQVHFGGVTLDLVAGRAVRTADSLDLHLTSTEFELLKAIVNGRGEVVARTAILDRLYGQSATITDRAIDAHIVRLRRKLALAAPDADLILTIHGAGYRLAAEVRAA